VTSVSEGGGRAESPSGGGEEAAGERAAAPPGGAGAAAEEEGSDASFPVHEEVKPGVSLTCRSRFRGSRRS